MVVGSVLKRAVVVHCRHYGCGVAGTTKAESCCEYGRDKREVVVRDG